MHIPSNYIRIFVLSKFFRLKHGKRVKIARKVKIISPWLIEIGSNTIINSSVLLDGRGKLSIGNNVDIAWFTKIITYQHDYESSNYEAYGVPVSIQDNCCVAVNAMLLPGAVIPEGSVVGAGSIVTKKLDKPNSIYAGIPAKYIRGRNCDIKYTLKHPSVVI